MNPNGSKRRKNSKSAPAVAFIALGIAALGSAACTVTPYGYGGGDAYAGDGYVGAYGGFYEPYGYDYGYWGGGYRIGPPRGDPGRGGDEGHGGRPGPGASGHGGGPPSIPHGSRGGGSGGGGTHR